VALAAQSTAPDVAALTLAQALDEARAANARLPAARLELEGAAARARQAQGRLYPSLALEGGLHDGAPNHYASGDALLRVLARVPIYQGGALRAGVDRSDAEAAAFQAGYRMARREVEQAVRVAFSTVLRADSSLAFRNRAIERLRSYLTVVQSRQAAGQGVSADVLRTRQRLATAEAEAAAAARDLAQARMTLNDLLGRAPKAALRLAPLPEPAAPPDTSGMTWTGVPDIAQGRARVDAAEAEVRAARAGRRPRVSLEADAGAQPVLGHGSQAPVNNGTGWGTQFMLSVSLPFWDHGVHTARLAEAGAALGEAQQRETIVRRASRLAWTRAAAGVTELFREFQARDRAADVARDAYLEAESLYRGGESSALEVLDAYDAWIQAFQDQIDTTFAYRVAEAELQRWGTP
jgi:outer membrane protein